MVEKEKDQSMVPARSRLIWAVCALLIGVVCTAAFFTMGPGAQTGAGQTAAPAVESSQGTGSGGSATDSGLAADAVDVAATRAILASWNTESASYQQLTSFVEEVCDPNSANYVAPEERVATFDMDGTFLCERAPIYIDQYFAAWHVLQDPSYQAAPELVSAVESAMDQVHAGIEPEDPDLNEVLDQCYAGKSPQELMSDVVSFAEKVQVEGFTGMTFSESFYKPMVEVIKYLRANDFDVFVVTACERYVSRALAVEFVDFAPDHVIGMDMPAVATGQGDELGVDYTFALDDEVLLAGTRERENGVKKSNKVFAIISQIGVRPILAFGNSSGDFAMLNYAASNPDHQGLGFLVIADDTVREYGNDEKAQEMRDTVAAQGWVGISMRDDWQTIYGEGVERTSLPTYEESAS